MPTLSVELGAPTVNVVVDLNGPVMERYRVIRNSPINARTF